MKLVQQYGRLNNVTMVIFVFIFVAMDMKTLYYAYFLPIMLCCSQLKILTYYAQYYAHVESIFTCIINI